KNKNISASERATAKLEQNKLYLELSENELEYWIYFFLIDYRDGMAEVDHIDLETKRIKGEPAVDIVLQRSHARPPLSPEELERKLGVKPS
ncbi:MAG: hypothetical protein H7A32_06210, partial [Deltaproteobacteria bacterium]|nr:hypothetical protein [Deltaproteobacteria bacterium]